MSTPLGMARRYHAAGSGGVHAGEALSGPGVQAVAPGGAIKVYQGFQARNEMLLADLSGIRLRHAGGAGRGGPCRVVAGADGGDVAGV